MDKFLSNVEKISEYSGRSVSYLLIPLILTVVYSVVIRYFFDSIVDWAFEVALFTYGILVMVGGAYTLKHKAHVRVDIFSYYVGHRTRCYLDLFSFLVVIVVCCALIYLGSKAAWISTLRLERSSLQTPFNPQIWWYKWIIPFSATLLGIQAIVEFIRTFQSINRDKQSGS